MGYEANFVRQPSKRHLCPVCSRAIKQAVQATRCGHIFCRDCLEPLLLQGESGAGRGGRGTAVCPVDEAEIIREEVFPDIACRREILSLEVHCDFVSEGCPWQGALKDLDSHMETCKHHLVQCFPYAHTHQSLVMVQGGLDERQLQKTRCPKQLPSLSLCSHCKEPAPLGQTEAHVEQYCTGVVYACPNNCDKELKMSRSQLEQHLSLKDGNCPLTEMACPFNVHGCCYISQRHKIPAHLQEYELYHLSIQAESTVENHPVIRRLVQKVAQDLNRRIENVAKESMQASVVVERGIDRLMRDTALPVGNDPLGGFTSNADYPTGSVTGAGGVMEIPPQRIENVDMHSRFAELDCALERCRLSRLDQELRLQLLEQGTYNGKYIWKIDEFKRRHREAVKGATISLYSSPFYTSRDGYKMCAQVFLNGDGTGKGTHLSLFFVVMKGPFDALLPWPFRQKVTFGLINQMGRGDVTDSFHPDPLSDSFQRPLKEMNVASGCPTFVSRELLWTGGFVKEDCIFLQIKVDTPNSCKKILTDPSPCHHGTKK